MDILERYVAIDNKCAWPNLTLMPDGTIVAAIFGEPCHQLWEGSSECWISRDGGKLWSFLSVPAHHEPNRTRGDLAAGLTHEGAYVVLCSGRKFAPPPGEPLDRPRTEDEKGNQEAVVCRTEDGCKTWTSSEGQFTYPPNVSNAVPFGDVVQLPGSRLAVSCYSAPAGHIEDETADGAWIYFSDDDGRTWGDARLIGADRYNETDLLVLGEGRMLAASRTARTAETEILASDDGGQTWTCRGPVTSSRHMPAHLLKLQDKSILLTYGVRLRGMLGVCAMSSRDDGVTWDDPRVLFNTNVYKSNTSPEGTDGGYPSSAQLADGTILTAYYCQRIPMHQRYHMGVVLWRD